MGGVLMSGGFGAIIIVEWLSMYTCDSPTDIQSIHGHFCSHAVSQNFRFFVGSDLKINRTIILWVTKRTLRLDLDDDVNLEMTLLAVGAIQMAAGGG